VIFWDSYESADFPQLWDPVTATITPAARAGYNIFCTGFSFLPDGRLFVVGGHISDNVGLSYASVYNPFTDTWTRVANMNAGRWYPTTTTLANGDVLTVSGMADTTVGMNLLPQVWQTASGSWRNLTNAQLQLPYYPYMFLAPNGRVFNAGPNQTTRYLDTSGSGAWTVVGNNRYGSRNWGSAVMYEPGKVLIVGGITGDFYSSGSAVFPTATAEAIDLNAPSPSWQYVASMAVPRKHHNLTLLPDGTVLVTGGSSGNEDTNSNSGNPAYAAEMWNPVTNTWTTLASNTVYRGYHATALLLPDGRVVSAGGDNGGASSEVYSPPYLFQGARPTITAAPPNVGYGQTFFAGTPDAVSITKVTLLPLSAVTHTNNMGQRLNTLSFSPTTGGLNITAPSSANQCPPGYYMLFILNGTGVPSVAKIIRIDSAAPTPPAAPSNLTATAVSSSQINLTWTDNSNNEDGFRIERCQGASCNNFAEIATVAANTTSYSNTGLTAATAYRYRLRAYNSAGNSAYSNIASATTSASTPAAPSSLTATAVSSSQINLTWTDNSNNEDGFRIERCQGAGCANFAEITTVGANATSYSNTGLTASTTYQYRVRAYNSTGNSAYSNIASATTLAAAVTPAPPSNLTATAISGSQINLAWTDNSTNEIGFKIERSLEGILFLELATVGGNVTTFSDSNLLPGITYYYRVRAYNGTGDSAYSNTASATTFLLPPPLAPPSNLTATAVSSSQINLAWTDNSSSETGFRIARSTDGLVWLPIGTTAANVVSYNNTGLSASTLYYYRVRARSAIGDSANSNTASAITQSSGGSASPFTDDFNDNSRSANWILGMIAAPGNYDSAVRVAEANQRLEITPRANWGPNAYNGYLTASSYDFTGLQAAIKLVQAPTGVTAEAVLTVGADISNRYIIGVVGPQIHFTSVFNGVWSQTFETYDPAIHSYLRIRHDPNDDGIKFETSAEGLFWTLRRSIPRNVAITNIKIDLVVGTYGPVPSPGVAIFDDFRLGTSQPPLSLAIAISTCEIQSWATFTYLREAVFPYGLYQGKACKSMEQ
jgi:hypothetical protein